jgi:hypothetical protein
MSGRTDESLIEEHDLDFSRFQCCGDEDLYPFGCPRCHRLMVFCCECDTLHGDRNDLTKQDWEVNHFDPSRPLFPCPGCGYEFEYFFTRDGRYQISRSEWIAAGFGSLLKPR